MVWIKIKKGLIMKSLFTGLCVLLFCYVIVHIGKVQMSDDTEYCRNECANWIMKHHDIFKIDIINPRDVSLKLGSVSTINNCYHEGDFDFKLPTGEYNIEFSDNRTFQVLHIKKYLMKSAFIVKDTIIYNLSQNE
jgi:hypothetical protein